MPEWGGQTWQGEPSRASNPCWATSTVPSTGHTFFTFGTNLFFTFYPSLGGQWEGFNLLFPRHFHSLCLPQAGDLSLVSHPGVLLLLCCGGMLAGAGDKGVAVISCTEG